MVAPRRQHLACYAVGCLVVLYCFLSVISAPKRPASLSRAGGGSVWNSTLGFQKVLAVGLKDRPDKHDALTVASSLTGFDITWLEGVRFEDLSPKAIPEKWDHEHDPKTAIGCWRAHLNAIQYIVDNHIQSALILEDDADWDWFLKEQLEGFAQSTRDLQISDSSTKTNSPYGDNWDMIWPGHCRVGPSDDEQDMHFLYNDPTVPPTNQRHSTWRQRHIMPEVMLNDTRIVFKAYAGMCLYAYALSYEGARKILGSLSLGQDPKTIDAGISDMCRQTHITPFNCYGIYPPLIASHRFAGSKSRDSDIRSRSKEVHPEFTFDVVFSVIQNAQRLLSGERSVKSQWPSDTILAERSIDEPLNLDRQKQRIRMSDFSVTQIEGINVQTSQ